MKTFAELELHSRVQRALSDERYETPTPIQSQTIPAALSGRDVLGCAQTGTGKTAAFALPILNRIARQNRKSVPNHPNALILAPTRELAIQIGDSCTTYGKHLRFRKALVYGGVNQRQQVRAMSRGAHVLIATPGRLLDLINQGHIKLDRLETFVLDEADRMLDMGFLPDLKRIIRLLPEERQSLFFSATLSPKITELAEELLSDPANVNVTPEKTSLEAIDQNLLYVEKHAKQRIVEKLVQAEDAERILVFTKTKRMANTVAEKLQDRGVKATAIHGNKSQAARQKSLRQFRENRVKVLVATDVAARGIDVDGVTHVINFDLPMEPENYVHRIGRTGRAGADGIAISFCSPAEMKELRAIEKLIEQSIPVDPEYPRSNLKQQESGSSRRPRKSYSKSGPSGNGKRKYRKGPASESAPNKSRSKPKRHKRRSTKNQQKSPQSG